MLVRKGPIKEGRPLDDRCKLRIPSDLEAATYKLTGTKIHAPKRAEKKGKKKRKCHQLYPKAVRITSYSQ
jgi:hypothetical protein